YLPALGWAAAALWVYARWRESGAIETLQLYAGLVENAGFPLYAAYLTLGLAALLHTYRTAASPVARRQIRWVFYGAVTSIAGVLLFGFLPIAAGVSLVPALDPQLGLLFALLFPVSLLFAIFRYRLMDIDLVIKRTISYSIVGALVTVAYLGASQLALLFAVSALRLNPTDLGPVNVLLGVVMGGLLLPARQRMLDTVDRRFFRERYAYQQSLATLSARLAQPQTAGRLVALLTGDAAQPMHIAWTQVLARTADGRFLPAAPDNWPEGVVLAVGDPLPERLRIAPQPLLLTQEGGARTAEAEGPGLVALRESGAALVLPLTAAGELVGVYVLGPKQSGDIYSTEDLQWLTTLAQQAAAALRTTELQAEVLEAERRREALKRYLSPQVAEVVMAAGDTVTLGGARYDVTVMFSDIRGFTTFSEQIRPEEVAHMLNQHLDAMTRAIFREGGTLDKYMGDCVMAVFGAPLPQKDHALRAVRAALAMQTAQAELQRKWMAEGRPRLSVGIGLNSGEVIAGNFGSHERLEYTVIGDVVNTAQRIEAGAPGDQVLISADTYRQAAPWLEVEELGPRAVKGRQAAVEVYRVIGLRDGETGPVAGAE
ncbi:MAG: GAF domain-containing protein, partial [Chloroflexi bacterium]|nr:GAF domain-containing protein [Chloroflexota bacterium]